MATIHISSTHGTFIADTVTGKCLTDVPYPVKEDDRGRPLAQVYIRKFDLEEYLQHYNRPTPPPCIDILDIGYWYSVSRRNFDGSEYEEPCADWREEVKLLRESF